jgi:hypothetical protein
MDLFAPREPENLALADEVPRFVTQCNRILARLREGPTSNSELAGIALKYTGRISELRKCGHTIVVVSRDRKTGLTWYALREEND